jgi:hypothetical protein
MTKKIDDDYGFSTFSAEEYEARISKAAEPINDYKERLEELESMILPFLQKLRDSGDKEYIYWPNRAEIINKQIERITKLTRG